MVDKQGTLAASISRLNWEHRCTLLARGMAILCSELMPTVEPNTLSPLLRCSANLLALGRPGLRVDLLPDTDQTAASLETAYEAAEESANDGLYFGLTAVVVTLGWPAGALPGDDEVEEYVEALERALSSTGVDAGRLIAGWLEP